MRGFEFLVGKEARVESKDQVGEISDVEEIRVAGGSEYRITVDLEDGPYNTDRSRVEVSPDA